MSNENFSVEIEVNDKKISLNPFVKSIVYNVVLGMVKSLKKIDEPKDIVIKVKSD